MAETSTPWPNREPHRPAAVAHTPLEDAQAILLGTALCALGVLLLTSAGLVTGQTAGLGILASYLTGWPFGLWFFVLNLPFYVLGWRRMGPRFIARTVIAVSLLSVFAALLPSFVTFERLDPWVASALAGAVTGMGLIVIFRHGASLGGIGILALWMQERFGVRAGWVQLGFDAVLFATAFVILDPFLALVSLLGAVIVNLVIAVNHRRDRYIGR
ncbi:YitT family protein [uncultured Jannaschia sp.]|uniref:YitT family protein n=1 Tax=uncultured Jannaschia sp. TaxID=293347 RepID=UPI00262220D4|nr:YitT family protein [uncultured Jannaschia sp.]